MAASKSGGSWASALKQPRSASSASQSRQPSGTATPVSTGQTTPAQASATAAPDSRPGTSPPKPAPAQRSNTTTPQPQASTSTEKTSSDPVSQALNQGDYTRLLGSKVELTLNDDKKHQGHIFAFDATMAVVALSSQACPQPGIAASYNILKSTEVRHVRVISATEAQTEGQGWKPPQVNLDRVSSNIEQAVKADQQRQARLGKGVSAMGQEIYDALSKTLPTAWVGQDIQVLDDILIAAPAYDASSTSFKQDALNTSSDQQQTKLQRVQKVLTGSRDKILASQPQLANGGATS